MVSQQTIVIDAKKLILGRLASNVAKRLIQGEKIVIVNAEEAVISGKKFSRINEAKKFLEIGHPGKGPLHPRRPDRLLRRTIRGMLPRRKPKGREAYRRLQVHIGIPKEFNIEVVQTIPDADVKRSSSPYITIGELAREIGWISNR